MSDLLTHWAVFDDAKNIANFDPKIEPFLLQILDEETESARLGAVTRYGSQWTGQILRNLRGRRDLNARERQKLAFALGGLLHYPADFIFKPVMSRLAKSDWMGAHHLAQRGQTNSLQPHREISAYYDIHVFKKVYLSGQAEPFSRFLVERNTTNGGQALEQFLRAGFQRAALSSHTLKPDMSDFNGWLDGLFDALQPLYIQIELYNNVWEHPDPQKIADYEVETTFYRDDDPILQLARAKSATPEHLEATLQNKAISHFGEAVRLGVLVLRDATQFWNGQTDAPPDVSQG